MKRRAWMFSVLVGDRLIARWALRANFVAWSAWLICLSVALLWSIEAGVGVLVGTVAGLLLAGRR